LIPLLTTIKNVHYGAIADLGVAAGRVPIIAAGALEMPDISKRDDVI
jgi:hypothetical protein